MQEETFTQSTTSTFEYFHTSSPNILDTTVPLGLWYHRNVTILIISTWRPFWHKKTNSRPQVEENIPQGIQFFRHPNFSFCLTKSILPLTTWWKVSFSIPLILAGLYSLFVELTINFVCWLLSWDWTDRRRTLRFRYKTQKETIHEAAAIGWGIDRVLVIYNR